MNGVAEDEEADIVEDEADDRGPVYADGEIVLVVPPIPWLIVFVLEMEGLTVERLVE